MPKFELSWESELNEPLSQMGMSVAFDRQRADFSDMGAGSGNLYISKVQHKTYVKVDEPGTEAAAATGVVAEFIGAKAFHSRPFQMIVDHPFLFAIAEQDSGAIEFVATITNPSQ